MKYYERLNVKEDASFTEIKTAYTVKLSELDRNRADYDLERRLLKEAYDEAMHNVDNHQTTNVIIQELFENEPVYESETRDINSNSSIIDIIDNDDLLINEESKQNNQDILSISKLVETEDNSFKNSVGKQSEYITKRYIEAIGKDLNTDITYYMFNKSDYFSNEAEYDAFRKTIVAYLKKFYYDLNNPQFVNELANYLEIDGPSIFANEAKILENLRYLFEELLTKRNLNVLDWNKIDDSIFTVSDEYSMFVRKTIYKYAQDNYKFLDTSFKEMLINKMGVEDIKNYKEPRKNNVLKIILGILVILFIIIIAYSSLIDDEKPNYNKNGLNESAKIVEEYNERVYDESDKKINIDNNEDSYKIVDHFISKFLLETNENRTKFLVENLPSDIHAKLNNITEHNNIEDIRLVSFKKIDKSNYYIISWSYKEYVNDMITRVVLHSENNKIVSVIEDNYGSEYSNQIEASPKESAYKLKNMCAIKKNNSEDYDCKDELSSFLTKKYQVKFARYETSIIDFFNENNPSDIDSKNLNIDGKEYYLFKNYHQKKYIIISFDEFGLINGIYNKQLDTLEQKTIDKIKYSDFYYKK